MEDEYDEDPIFKDELDRVIRLAPKNQLSQTVVASKKECISLCAFKVFEEAEDDDDFPEQYGPHIFRCVGNMLLNELTLSQCGHFVFYRVITEKVIPYELHTVLLYLLGFTVREEGGLLGLVPTACIMEDVYPTDMEDLVKMFNARDVSGDMSEECMQFMISCNCSMLPQGNDSAFHMGKLYHVLEAPPARFYKGYDITEWTCAVKGTFEKVLCLDPPGAERLLGQIQDLYTAHSKPDDTHLLQINIPNSQVERFAYMSVAYGYPVTVLEDVKGKRTTYRWNAAALKALPEGTRVLNIHEILACPELAKLQTRIIAHPNLFLVHGATVTVESSRPGYDRKKFQDGIMKLLEPYVERMVLPRFEKFA
jgi:hypothetical protein